MAQVKNALPYYSYDPRRREEGTEAAERNPRMRHFSSPFPPQSKRTKAPGQAGRNDKNIGGSDEPGT
jgi:hypothetical protein